MYGQCYFTCQIYEFNNDRWVTFWKLRLKEQVKIKTNEIWKMVDSSLSNNKWNEDYGIACNNTYAHKWTQETNIESSSCRI